MNPCTNTSKRRYSDAWAWNVVKKLLGKYARATEILSTAFDIEPRDIQRHLAHNDGNYPVIRDIIHYIDRMIEWIGYDAAMNSCIRHTQQAYSKQMAFDDVLGHYGKNFHLTDLREWARLNSQGFKGGGGRRSRPPASFSGRPRERYI